MLELSLDPLDDLGGQLGVVAEVDPGHLGPLLRGHFEGLHRRFASRVDQVGLGDAGDKIFGTK